MSTTPDEILPEMQERDIRSLLTEALYKQMPLALAASICVAFLTMLVIWKDVPLAHLAIWSLALLAICALRYLLYRMFVRSGNKSTDEWYRRYFIGILIAGLVWGGFVWILPRDMPIEHWIFIIFILGGMMAGGSTTSGAILSGYLAFVLPICLSAIAWFHSVDLPFATSMSILIVLYTVVLIVIVTHASSTLRETFRLRFANVELINRLTQEQGHSAHLVDELRQEVSRRADREEQLNEYNRLLEMLAQGEALPVILANLNASVERQLQGGMSSILMLDAEGRKLSTVSAPSLPSAYNDALQDQEIGPDVGSCGAAAYRNATVIAEDIETNPRWENYRELALSHHLRSCWSTPVRNAFGRVLGTLAIYHNTPYTPSKSDLEITMAAANIAGIAIETKQAEQRLQSMAHHDQLTQLANRTYLYDQLAFIISQAKRRDIRFALLFIDLDNFKEINDSLGHEAGDRLLQSVAQTLKAAVRDSDIVSRFGGDEFVILLMNTQDTAAIDGVVEKILGGIAQPYPAGQKVWHVGASIGVSLFPDDGRNADTLIQRADQAMYHAKAQGTHHTYYAALKKS